MELFWGSSGRNIIKPESNSSSYEIVVTEIQLRLRYCVIESAIRNKYYSSVGSKTILRSFNFERVASFGLDKSKLVHYLNNIFSYVSVPEYLIVFFQSEGSWIGDHSNRYTYSHENVKSLSVYRDGVSLLESFLFENMNLKVPNSAAVFHLYNEFCRLVNKNYYVSFSQWYKDYFCYVIDLKMNPVHFSPNQQAYELTSVSSLDVQICFSQLPTTNLTCTILGSYSSYLSIDGSGDILDS